jgi:hypothetical protein
MNQTKDVKCLMAKKRILFTYLNIIGTGVKSLKLRIEKLLYLCFFKTFIILLKSIRLVVNFLEKTLLSNSIA